MTTRKGWELAQHSQRGGSPLGGSSQPLGQSLRGRETEEGTKPPGEDKADPMETVGRQGAALPSGVIYKQRHSLRSMLSSTLPGPQATSAREGGRETVVVAVFAFPCMSAALPAPLLTFGQAAAQGASLEQEGGKAAGLLHGVCAPLFGFFLQGLGGGAI